MTQKVLVPKALSADIFDLLSGAGSMNESGGLLLGFRKGDAIELTTMTRPNRWDRGTPTRFFRSSLGHRIAALRAWKLSRGTVDWVGEWHTHPFGSSSPSSIDQGSWVKIVKHCKRPMVFMIGGRNEIFVGVQEPDNRKVVRLNRIDSDPSFDLFAV